MTRSTLLPLCIFCLLSATRLLAQPGPEGILLKPLRGAPVSFSTAAGRDSVVLVCFWTTGNEQSISELNAISSQFEEWKKLVAFKMMAVCVDEGRDANRVRPTVNANGWLFDVYIDLNGDLRRYLKSVNVPQAIILVNGQPVYQQSGFGSGSESYLISRIQELTRSR